MDRSITGARATFDSVAFSCFSFSSRVNGDFDDVKPPFDEVRTTNERKSERMVGGEGGRDGGEGGG